MAPSLLQSFSILLAASQAILAVPSPATQAACADIQAAVLGKLFVKSDAAYIKENKDWWNSGITDMAPACIAMPSSAAEVSKIVAILNKHTSVPFAIKSGGHSPNRGQSSVEGGVLIALRNLAGVELDKAKSVAYVKPGGHWKDVVKPLDDQGYTVVSGRLGMFFTISGEIDRLTTARCRWDRRFPRARRTFVSQRSTWHGCRCRLHDQHQLYKLLTSAEHSRV